jgi:hypothetical protein
MQTGLLRRALDACRTGGRVVYSTCTFAPEENEMVIDEVLRTSPYELSVLPIEMPTLRTRPGLTEWEGRQMHPSLARSIRIWPHEADTGGFFAAVLEKRSGVHAAPAHVVSPTWPSDDPRVRDVLAALCDRYGIDQGAMDGYRFWTQDKKYIRTIAADHAPGLPFGGFTRGLSILRIHLDYPKPTTQASILFNHLASRNTVDLPHTEALRFAARLDTEVRAKIPSTLPGFVIVRCHGLALGIGILRTDAAIPFIQSLHPKTWGGLTAPTFSGTESDSTDESAQPIS